MKHRAAAFLTGAALMLFPATASAQREPGAIERMSDGFEAMWAEAGETGLKIEEKPVDMRQFRTVVPPPWSDRDYAELQAYKSSAPPTVEGVRYGNDPLRNWLDWYDLEIEAAREAGDRKRLLDAWQDKLFIIDNAARYRTTYGPSSYPYQEAIRGFIADLEPQPDYTGVSFRSILTMAPEERAQRLDQAYAAAPPEHLTILETALRHYLSIIANENFDGPPREGDALQDSGANQVKILADLLDFRGGGQEAAQVRAASDAFEYNSSISGFNWLVNYRHQNVVVGNYKVAAEWSRRMIESLSSLNTEVGDPRWYRVLMLGAADHFADLQTDTAERILEIARSTCSKDGGCTNIADLPAATEALAMLDDLGATGQAQTMRAALTGSSASAGPQVAALNRIPALQRELEDCYNQAEPNPENPFILTSQAKAIVAECDAVIGPDIFAAYEEAGNDFSKSDAMKTLAEQIGDGALRTGRYDVAEPYFARLVADGRASGNVYADELALRQAMALIALERFAEADQVLAQTRASSDADMSAGLLYSNDYSRRITGVEALTVERYLRDIPRAAEAFDLAKARAESDREFRQSQVGSVFNETNLARIIGFNSSFREAADASWAMAQSSRSRTDEAKAVAFAAVQDALADKTSLSLAYAMADKAEFGGDARVSQLVARRRDLLEALAPHRGVDAKMWDGKLPNNTREEIERRREFEAVAELSNEYAAINRTLQSAAPDYFKLIRPAPLSLEDAQAILEPEEAVLLLLPSDYGTHAMALTKDGLRWHRSDLTFDEINQIVRRLLWFSGGQIEPTNEELAEWSDGVDGGAKGFDRDTAHRLYSELIAPLSDAFDGKRHLFYAGGGSLGSLPLGILVTDTPTGRDDDPEALRDTKWLAGEANIVRIPSLQALAFQRRYGSEGAANADEFRGFGDPVLAGKAQTRSRGTRGAPPSSLATLLTRSDAGPVANVETLRRLARLPGTEQELTQMARAFGTARSAIKLGEQATEIAFKQADLDNVGVIALATHGLTAGEVGAAEPGLVFTPPATGTPQDDGYLTASEVAAMRIDADWVILSACNTAAGDGESGAGLSGLARAFFYAGASNLLASHWPVRDDVAARLTVRTIELARDNSQMSRAEAFAAAMREIREDSSADGKLVGGYDTTFAHPNAWAPFELIGDTGAR